MDVVRAGEASLQIDIPAYDYPGSWMIGASTFAIDHIVPDVERIWIPEATHPFAGFVRFQLSDRTTVPAIRRTSRKLRLINRLRVLPATDLGDRIFFDTRHDDYFNWSHQTNFYLTLALAARKWLGEDMTIIVAVGMPPILFELYRLFGFEVVSTDGPVQGRSCKWSVSHWETVPCGRKILVPDDYDLPNYDTPKKVFIARRGPRSILNEAEVDAVLAGYNKVFPEKLSAAEQFDLFRNATDIVAVHGAALAPMQYRPSTAPPLRLVELTPVAMATRWFGIMCHQVGGKYIQVRGRIKPEYVPYLYGTEPYVAHVNDSFEVDPKSLEVALQMIA